MPSMREAPDDTAPQRNAHIGGNHVIGLISVNVAFGSGQRRSIGGMSEAIDIL